jgi:hypothetical protein
MFEFLYRITDFQVFLVVSVASIIVSIIIVTVVRHYKLITLRYKDDPALGNASAMIGIIYGVLVGLTALHLINDISYTEDAVQREANAVANILRDIRWVTSPINTEIQTDIRRYLVEVINIEWPLMEKGASIDQTGDTIIDHMGDSVIQYSHLNHANTFIIQDMLEEIKTLYDARQQRIHMSFSSLNSEMWIVLLIGTFLTIAINFFLRMSFFLHIIAVSASALMASSMIFLVVTLDRPFQGEFVIEPDAMKSLLTTLDKTQQSTVDSISSLQMKPVQ